MSYEILMGGRVMLSSLDREESARLYRDLKRHGYRVERREDGQGKLLFEKENSHGRRETERLCD